MVANNNPDSPDRQREKMQEMADKMGLSMVQIDVTDPAQMESLKKAMKVQEMEIRQFLTKLWTTMRSLSPPPLKPVAEAMVTPTLLAMAAGAKIGLQYLASPETMRIVTEREMALDQELMEKIHEARTKGEDVGEVDVMKLIGQFVAATVKATETEPGDDQQQSS